MCSLRTGWSPLWGIFEGIGSFETGTNASWLAMVECDVDEVVIGMVPVDGLGTPEDEARDVVRSVEVLE